MSQQLRIGVLGAGWGAGLHLEGFRRVPGVTLAALSSRTRSRAERRAAEFGVPLVTDDIDELIEAVDVVSVATPPAAHLDAVLAAVRAGRHVLCDKPVALTAPDARAMLDAAERAGVRHASGFIWRNDPALVELRRLLREGAIGPVLEVHSTGALGVPVLPMTWMYEAGDGGGALAQHGSHVIDRARWLVGAEVTAVCGRLHHDVKEAVVAADFHDITDAFAWARQHHGTTVDAPRAPVRADTGYDFVATFDSGVRARFWEAWHLAGPAEDEVVVFGETGTLRWRGASGLTLHRIGAAPEVRDVDRAAGSGANTPREIGLARWGELAAAFVAAINGAADTGHPTLTDGWRVAAISDAVRRSHHSGRWEEVR
ncbi:Gfo/Idh/MocA family oxidoreductase [Micromonospora sp. NPDC049171]|uniref:Gfo/Idh/MocA family protein n=1 Tax=Micromonospora sp. NPDC049171 TaxID=3155770 RepID=UPI0033CAE3D3